MIPKTFSAPGSDYEPSIWDRVRDAVWLMMWSDAAHRKYYSFDDGEDPFGIRISAGYAHTRNKTYDVPQQLIQNAVESVAVDLLTQRDAVTRVTIAIVHFEKPTTSKIDVDVDAPTVTPESVMGRTVEILNRGTLVVEGRSSENGVLIDPHGSPLLEDGTYDPELVRRLNTAPPAIRFGTPTPIRRSTSLSDFLDKEWEELDPATDIAVLYSVMATYEIDVADRDDMRHGGTA